MSPINLVKQTSSNKEINSRGSDSLLKVSLSSQLKTKMNWSLKPFKFL